MQIEQTALSDGLTVITAALKDFETAAVMVVVRAGSRDETADNNGVAHFLEHMAFKGTASRSALDISVEIECLGASINAFTSQEFTAYYIVGLRQSVADAMSILGDVLIASRYAPADIDLERNVIAQEIARNNDDPHAQCVQGFIATAYAEQSLGRPILGNPEFVAGLGRDDLLAFITSNYTAANMVVAAAGNVDHAWLVGLAGRHFAAISTAAPPAQRTPPTYIGGMHRQTREDFKQVNVVLGFPSVSARAPELHAHRMLAGVLGGGMSSPLFQEVRQKRGLVYGVGTGSNHGTDFGIFLIQAGMTPQNLQAYLPVVCAEARRLITAIEPRDITRARNSMLAELATVKEKPFQLALYLASQFFRDGRAIGPQPDLDGVNAVTPDDLHHAAHTLLSSPPTLSMVGPVGEGDYLGIVREELSKA
jgi:predicted Zn-dependent peptidase